MRILRVANHLAVDPHIISRIDTVKPENDLTPIPVLGQSKRAAIGGDGIEVRKPRLSIKNLGPSLLVRIANVRIVRNTISAHLDAAWDINYSPARIIETNIPKIGRTPSRIADPFKLPITVKRKLIWSFDFNSIVKSILFFCKRKHIRRSRHTITGVYFHILPVVHSCLGKRIHARSKHTNGYNFFHLFYSLKSRL